MVKHTQTIRRQTANELFECVWTFCEVSALGLTNKSLRPGSKISRIPYVNNLSTSILNNKWKNVFKNEKNKICGRQP